jgi:hypothetical protein
MLTGIAGAVLLFSEVNSDDAFLAAPSDRLKKVEKGCAVTHRVPIGWEEFAAVTGFLCRSSIVELKQGRFDGLEVHIGWVPAGIKVAWFVFAGYETAVEVHPFASRSAEVVHGLREASQKGLAALIPTEPLGQFCPCGAVDAVGEVAVRLERGNHKTTVALSRIGVKSDWDIVGMFMISGCISRKRDTDAQT